MENEIFITYEDYETKYINKDNILDESLFNFYKEKLNAVINDTNCFLTMIMNYPYGIVINNIVNLNYQNIIDDKVLFVYLYDKGYKFSYKAVKDVLEKKGYSISMNTDENGITYLYIDKEMVLKYENKL